MSSHLTVSVELVAFMKWMLKHKRALLNQLVKTSLNEGLREEVVRASDNANNVSIDELYGVVNTFLKTMENVIVDDLTAHYDAQVLDDEEAVAQIAANRTHSKKKDAASDAWIYKTLDPHTQAQVQTISEKNGNFEQSMQEAARLFSANSDDADEKKSAVMRALLNNWKPKNEEDVN